MSTTQIKAEMIDGTLIVSVTGNDNPVLWRMALPTSKAVFFELAEDGKTHSLIMRSGKTKKDCIAKFSQKENAQDALNVVINTMMTTNSDTKQESKKTETPKTKGKGSKTVFITLILLTFALFVFFEYLQYNLSEPKSKQTAQQVSSTSFSPTVNNASTTVPKKKIRKGVPISADDLFQ